MTELEESFGAELELRAREGARSLADPSSPSTASIGATRRNRASAIATGFALLLAGLLAWKMWDAYMLGPGTRDATVRAYVIAEVPEVSGQITRLPVRFAKIPRNAACSMRALRVACMCLSTTARIGVLCNLICLPRRFTT